MLSLVVLAAGKGTRMRSDLPKVLHPLLGQPLLEYPLELVEGLGVDRRAVVIGHGREHVEAAFEGRGLLWAVQEPQLGTGHAALVGIERLREEGTAAAGGGSFDVLILNGDLPLLSRETVKALVERHRQCEASATVLTCRKRDPFGFGRIVRDSEGCFGTIVEEADADVATRALPEVNVGTYLIRAESFLEAYGSIDRDNRQGEYYLPDVVVAIARAGGRVETVESGGEEETAQVNSRRELAEASAILRERMLGEWMDAGVTVDDPATTYIEKGVEIGRDAHIHPFTVIRRGVTVGPGCEVGPFAHLRPGTRLEPTASIGNFVEIKNSRIGEGSKARHLTYVGDGEVGKGVNIGAGCIFANYDGKVKSRTEVGDGAFVGSGTILVAPVRVGRGSMTGAGAVVLRNRDVKDGEVVAGVPARPLGKKKG